MSLRSQGGTYMDGPDLSGEGVTLNAFGPALVIMHLSRGRGLQDGLTEEEIVPFISTKALI